MKTISHPFKLVALIASLVAILQGLAGCTPKTSTQVGSDSLSLSSARAGISQGVVKPNAPILIFADGLSTCGGLVKNFNGNAFAQADKILAAWKIKSGMTPGYVYSCYGAANELYVTTSSNPKIAHLNDVSELFTLITKEVGTDTSRPIAFVGHSYGGWTVMKSVLGLAPGMKVKALITSDPISRAECLPSIVVAELNPFSSQPASNAEPCLRSPKDLDAAQVKARVGSWTNLYQNDFPLLHSSPISGADQNQLIKRDVVIKANAHIKMDADPRVWDVAAKLIVQ